MAIYGVYIITICVLSKFVISFGNYDSAQKKTNIIEDISLNNENLFFMIVIINLS